jgi:hypothetical protein
MQAARLEEERVRVVEEERVAAEKAAAHNREVHALLRLRAAPLSSPRVS